MGRIVTAFVVVSSFIFVPSALAQPGPPTGGLGAGGTTVITKAVPDFSNPSNSRFIIHGDNFGSNPQVSLGDDMGILMPLSTTFVSNTLIVANLPVAVVPGTYVLIVQAGLGPTDTGIIDVTLGAVGPQGPPGQDGQDGAPGLPGASPWGLNGNDTFYTTGNVGIGTDSPAEMLSVVGTAQFGSPTPVKITSASINLSGLSNGQGSVSFGGPDALTLHGGLNGIWFRTNDGADHIKIFDNAFVHIGSPQPFEAGDPGGLEVVGSILAEGISLQQAPSFRGRPESSRKTSPR